MMNNEKKILLTVFVIFLLTSTVALFLRTKQRSLPSSQALPSVSPAPQAHITLKMKDGRKVIKRAEPVVLEVVANSNNVPISGYDINILFPVPEFTFKSFTSLDGRFMTTTTTLAAGSPSQKKLVITGTVPIEKQPPILNDTVLGTVTFDSPNENRVGNVEFMVEFEPGSKKDSNLIDTKSHDILGGVTGPVDVAFGKQMTLVKGKAATAESTKLYLRLVSTTVPESTCRDCLTEAKIEFSTAANFTGSKIIDFSSGGFAGTNNLSKTVLSGWVVEIDSIKGDSVVLRLAQPGG